jgi:hypothetical protein
MSTVRALNRAHAALQGVESKNGFLGEETLLRLVQAESFLSRHKKYANEHLRVFREAYREYSRQLEKLTRKNLAATKSFDLTKQWVESTVRYLGFHDFIETSIPHWDQDGSIVFRRSAEGGHSVGLFFAIGSQLFSCLDESKSLLTDVGGNETYKTSKKATLAEQVERAMRVAELPEAILITPHFACYFRADSKITGSCLEIRWADVFKTDNDTSAVLATTLLHADFFQYSGISETSAEEAAEDEGADADESDGDEEAGGGSTNARGTPSQDLFKEDLVQARKITEDLHKQVMLALEILANERIEIDPEFRSKAIAAKTNEQSAQALFKDGLFVLYRVLFVLYAEARRFLPVENARYASFYSVEHLRDWSEEYLKKVRMGDADGSGTYLWDSLKTIFTLLRRGVKLPGGELVSAYNGQLFSPEQAPLFDEGPSLRDGAIARVLTTISRIGGEDSGRRLHFGNLGIEQLGAVYEALLAQKPVVVREPSCWVVAHPVGVGLVSKDFAGKMGHTVVEVDAAQGLRDEQRKKLKGKKAVKSSKTLSDFISKDRPAYLLKIGRFVVAPMGGQRRQTASHYTPPKLAEFLVKRTLKPLVEGKSSKEILSLKIVEPAVGSGGFLIACLRYIAPHLLDAKRKEGDENLRGREPTFNDIQECKREILERCLFGVDVNPLSLELCRTSLYLEALVPGSPLPFLHHRLKAGNALVYADLLGKAKSTFNGGVVQNNEEPNGDQNFWSVFELPVDYLKVENNVWEAWDQQSKMPYSDKLAEELKKRVSELKAEKKDIEEQQWVSWALESQNKVTHLLRLSQKAIEEFESIQKSNEVVDGLDARHRDRLSLIPDMDPVLIEVQGIEIDPRLERQRKQALIREHGIQFYGQLVKHQRAFMRLKMFADLHCALWFWPVDLYSQYPSYADFQELVEWLLDAKTLGRDSKVSKLSNKAHRLLSNVARIEQQEKFFQWHVEFAQVFGTQTPGFSAVISNPPWKLMRIKDKEVYPSFDPYFNKWRGAEKKNKLDILRKEQPASTRKWMRDQSVTSNVINRWESGVQSAIPSSGQTDLCSLFVLNSERLVTEERILNAGARIGLLISRSAVFTNSASKTIRRRLFEDWGLVEAVSFVNLLEIFSIDSRYEFTALVGCPITKSTPKFVHAVVDPNQLDAVESALENKKCYNQLSQHKPIEIDLDTIARCFARETLAIPGLTDPRQLIIAKSLHNPLGNVSYLSSLTCKVWKGIDPCSKSSKATFVDQFSEKDKKRIFTGSHQEYSTLLRGRSFALNGLRVDFADTLRHVVPREDELQDNPGATDLLLWRVISNRRDQRTFIVGSVSKKYLFDGNVFGIDVAANELTPLKVIFGSICMDYLVRVAGGGAIGKSNIEALPIANYNTKFLAEACKLPLEAWSEKGSPKVDALIWLHYGQNQGALNRQNLEWMLETQFDCLKRNSPDYIQKVLVAFDHYSKQKEMYGIDPTPIFKLKDSNVIPIRSTEIEGAVAKKKPKKARA